MNPVTSIRGMMALGISVVLALAACGGSSSGPPTSAATAGGSGASSASAKIVIVADFTSALAFSVAESEPTVKGALRGFPNLEITTCDSKGTAAGALTCERNAVSDHVAAVVSAYSQLALNETLLTRAGIPVVGNADTTSPVSFAVSSVDAQFGGIGISLAEAGCTKLGILYYEGTDFLADLIQKGIEAKGGTEVARAAVPANAPDLAPSVGKLIRAGAECIGVSVPPAAAVQALTAIKQTGKKPLLASVSSVFSQEVIRSLGPDLANGLIVVDQQAGAGDTVPGIAEIRADIASQHSTAPVTQIGVTSWIAAKLIAAALPRVRGAVTAATLLTALNGLRDVDLKGVVHPWSSIELKTPKYRRLFNHYGITYTVTNSTLIRKGDFFNLSGTPFLD